MHQQLAHTGHTHTINILQEHGNILSRRHEQALYRVHNHMAAASLGKRTGRVAFALPTGTGKTTAVVGHVKAILDTNLRCSLLICQEKVEALCELYRALIRHGVPEDRIGLVHSYLHDPEKALAGIESYATEAATPEHEIQNRQFLLLTHNKVKGGRFDLDKYYRYEGRRRDLCIWDESLIASQGSSLDKSSVAGDIAKLLTTYEQRVREGRHPKHSHTILYQYLAAASQVIEDVFGQDHSDVFMLPAFDISEGELKKAVDSILGKSHESSRNLRRLIELARNPCRSVVDGNHALIQSQVVVPDDLDNVIILDASAPIRKLKSLDRTIRHDPSHDLFKSYENVTIHYWKGTAGRASLEEEFEKGSDNAISAEAIKIITETRRKFPKEHIYIFTYKRKNTKRGIAELLRQQLEKEGINPDAEDDKGRPYIQFLTWGMETNLNEYSHCKHAIFVGVMSLPLPELAAQAAGQARLTGKDTRLLSIESLEEIRLSEQTHLVYQAVSRGHSRRTYNGLAGDMHIYVFHSRINALKEQLDKVMPLAKWTPYQARHMSNGQTKAQANAFLIASCIEKLDVKEISSKKLRQDHFSHLDHNQWREASREVRQLLKNWEPHKRSYRKIT